VRPADGKLHFSDLKHIATTPKEFDHQRTHKRPDTKSFKLGRAVHSRWLLNIAPDVYEDRRDKRIKAYQEYLQQLEVRDGEPPDPDNILNDAENTLVLNMVRALDSHPLAAKLKLACPEREKYMQWTRNGIECAGTLDMMGPRGILDPNKRLIVDLKSCEHRRIEPKSFQRAGMWLRYPEQLSWYDIGTGTKRHAIPGMRSDTQWSECWVIAIESTGAHDFVCHHLPELLLDRADEEVERWLTAYQACRESGRYPGWSDDPVEWDADVDFDSRDADD
jgi:hypothetical protein